MDEYMKRLQLAQSGLIAIGGFIETSVSHDDYCAIYKGGKCNCDPDITAMTESSAIRILKDGSIVKLH